MRVRFAGFISFFLNILIMSETKLFHFHGIFKNGGMDYVYMLDYVEILAVLYYSMYQRNKRILTLTLGGGSSEPTEPPLDPPLSPSHTQRSLLSYRD